MTKGRYTFLLDIAYTVKIVDLYKNIIKLSEIELEIDIKIVFSGLRSGEKLYEELLIREEGLISTEKKKIFIGNSMKFDVDIVIEEIRDIYGGFI